MYYENSDQTTDTRGPIGSADTPQACAALFSHDHNHDQIMDEDDNDDDDDDDDQLMKKKLSVKWVPRRRTLLRTPEGSYQPTTLHDHALQAV